jgi:hypothetical protein
VYIVFDLDPALEIQAGFTFAVSEMGLCQRMEAAPLPFPGGACFNLLRTTVTVKLIIIMMSKLFTALLSHYKMHDII